MIKQHYIQELNLQALVKTGSKGFDVKKVQEWLNLQRIYDNNWFHKVTVDEEYGPQTETIVKEFQSKNSLQVDGIIGDQTFRALTSHMINAFTRINGNDLRKLIIQYAEQHLKNKPQELYNSNQGPWVRAYMDGHEGKEWAWCMGFVQTVLDQSFSTLKQQFTSIMPQSYSCDVVGEHGLTNKKLIRNVTLRQNSSYIEPGDIFLISKRPHDWIHTGIVISVQDDWIHTIEGNSNENGSREGFEVCLHMRNYKTHDIDIFKVI